MMHLKKILSLLNTSPEHAQDSQGASPSASPGVHLSGHDLVTEKKGSSIYAIFYRSTDEKKVTAQAISNAIPHRHQDYTDIGSGTGSVSIPVAKHIQADPFTAIDPSQACLYTLNKNAIESHLSNVFLRVGSYNSTIFTEETHGVISMMYMLGSPGLNLSQVFDDIETCLLTGHAKQIICAEMAENTATKLGDIRKKFVIPIPDHVTRLSQFSPDTLSTARSLHTVTLRCSTAADLAKAIRYVLYDPGRPKNKSYQEHQSNIENFVLDQCMASDTGYILTYEIQVVSFLDPLLPTKSLYVSSHSAYNRTTQSRDTVSPNLRRPYYDEPLA